MLFFINFYLNFRIIQIKYKFFIFYIQIVFIPINIVTDHSVATKVFSSSSNLITIKLDKKADKFLIKAHFCKYLDDYINFTIHEISKGDVQSKENQNKQFQYEILFYFSNLIILDQLNQNLNSLKYLPQMTELVLLEKKYNKHFKQKLQVKGISIMIFQILIYIQKQRQVYQFFNQILIEEMEQYKQEKINQKDKGYFKDLEIFEKKFLHNYLTLYSII